MNYETWLDLSEGFSALKLYCGKQGMVESRGNKASANERHMHATQVLSHQIHSFV